MKYYEKDIEYAILNLKKNLLFHEEKQDPESLGK